MIEKGPFRRGYHSGYCEDLRMSEKKRILIIDDDESVCQWLKLKLETTGGFEVDYALNADQGIEMASRLKPDLAVVDILMPGKDGGETAYDMAQRPDTRKIKVLFLSALASAERVTRPGQLIGGQLIVPKDIGFPDLLLHIKAALDPD